MTFAAVGSAIFDATGTVSITPHSVGNLILLEVTNKSNNTVFATAVTSANATWTQLGSHFAGTTNAFTATLFAGKASTTSAAAISITWSGSTPGTIRNAGQEFSSTVGNWALDVQGNLDGGGTNTWPSLTPAGSGELYFGWGQDSGSSVSGSTSGYTYSNSPQGNGMAYNPACSASAQAPVWGDSGMIFGIMALVKEVASSVPAGVPQPRATVPVPRRAASRAAQRSVLGAANAHGPSGAVQPRATVPVPRRAAARAWWRAILGPGNASGPAGQPPGGTVIRRVPVSAVWGGYASSLVVPPAPPPGQVQPRATIPVPRRYQARASWAQALGPANAHGPSGTVQPRAAVPVPRRTAARAVIASALGALNAHGPSGQVQPRAAVPVPRRQAVRGSWQRQSTPQPHLPGQVQPRATVPVPRRTAARAVIASVAGALNAHGPSGTVQPRATVPVPRRTGARGLTASALGTANAHGGNGQVQPPATRQPRRAAARAVVRFTPVTTVNAAPAPPVNGTVQPPATAPHRPHAAQRVIWRGNAAPGTQPQAATGGLVKRRTAARGQWRSVAGFPPPAAQAATPATGGRVVTRRPPSRGQWRGTTVRTTNTLPVAVPAPRQRLTVPRRTAARAVWTGTVVTTVNGHGIPGLWALGRARQPWTTGRARQTWTTGRARNE